MASSVDLGGEWLDLGGEIQTVRSNPFCMKSLDSVETQVFLSDSEILETNYSQEIPKYFLE